MSMNRKYVTKIHAVILQNSMSKIIPAPFLDFIEWFILPISMVNIDRTDIFALD